MSPKLSVVIPLYNEVSTAQIVLESLIKKSLPSMEIEFLLIESNSTDGTREIVKTFERKPNVRVIWEDEPMGKGHAVRAGLGMATGDVILIQDADLEYSIDDYEKLLEPILSGKTDFVLGTRHRKGEWGMRRFQTGSHYAVLFNAAHWAFTALLNFSLGVEMTDPFTMFKVFRRSCLQNIKLECNRFDLDWELVIKLIKGGYLPLEVPVSYNSRDFKDGKKISIWRDPPTWLAAWWRYAVLGR